MRAEKWRSATDDAGPSKSLQGPSFYFDVWETTETF